MGPAKNTRTQRKKTGKENPKCSKILKKALLTTTNIPVVALICNKNKRIEKDALASIMKKRGLRAESRQWAVGGKSAMFASPMMTII